MTNHSATTNSNHFECIIIRRNDTLVILTFGKRRAGNTDVAGYELDTPKRENGRSVFVPEECRIIDTACVVAEFTTEQVDDCVLTESDAPIARNVGGWILYETATTQVYHSIDSIVDVEVDTSFVRNRLVITFEVAVIEVQLRIVIITQRIQFDTNSGADRAEVAIVEPDIGFAVDIDSTVHASVGVDSFEPRGKRGLAKLDSDVALSHSDVIKVYIPFD